MVHSRNTESAEEPVYCAAGYQIQSHVAMLTSDLLISFEMINRSQVMILAQWMEALHMDKHSSCGLCSSP